MNALIRLGLRRGWRHGVLNGERGWLIVGGVALLLRMLVRAIAKEESVVFREVLQPGDRLLISHEPPV
jgi:hypothetical protein